MLGVTRTPLFSIFMSWTVKYTRKENTRLNGLILRFKTCYVANTFRHISVQNGSGPLSKTRDFPIVNSISYGDNSIKIVKINLANNFTTTSYFELFPFWK